MISKRLLLLVLVLLSFATYSAAQAWSGIISSGRAVDWTQAGVVGGVPSASWTQCGSTIPAGASAATINAAIASCGANHYVSLSSGTYNITGLLMKNNVALRGQGADQTFLVFTGNYAPCTIPADICFQPSGFVYYGGGAAGPGGSNAFTWSSGYTAGTNSIVLSGIGNSGLSVGQYINLDVANDTSDTGNLVVCDTTTPFACSAQGGSPGRTISGVDYSQTQLVKITACSPSCTNGSTFTISPGIYASNIATAKHPGGYWSPTIQNSGIENLSLDHTATGGSSGGGIVMAACFNCWVSGIRSVNATYRNHVWFFQSGHNTVQNSYFYGAAGASLSYGIESRLAGDDLIVNNIFQAVTTPLIIGTAQAEVSAYNFSINDYYSQAPTYLDQSAYAHDAASLYNLFEGNIGNGFRSDVIHGTSGMNTLFRNRYNGWESGKTHQLEPMIENSFSRYFNVIGNVLGQPTIQTSYQTTTTQGGTSIYELGTGDCCDGTVVPNDSLVPTTLMRWGNYDTITAAVRWCGNSSDTGWTTVCSGTSEIPSGLSLYANSIPSKGDTGAGQSTMPASFYYSAMPSFWSSSKPWPAIGPDVSNGNLGMCSGGTMDKYACTNSAQCTGGGTCASAMGGHVNSIPAQDCYLAAMGGPVDGSGAVRSFNASTCYDSSAPAPPSNLTAVPY